MQFYLKKRRAPVVPIVSLIDILAILLIFFIVTTTFKQPRELLSIELPDAANLTAAVESRERTTLAVTAEGEIFLDGSPVEQAELADVLAALKSGRPTAQLELKADEAVPLGLLVKIWDGITKAGFKVRDVPARITLRPDADAAQ